MALVSSQSCVSTSDQLQNMLLSRKRKLRSTLPPAGDHSPRPASGSAGPGRHADGSAHGPAHRGALRPAPSLRLGLQGLVRAEACVDTSLLFLLDNIAPLPRPPTWGAPTFWPDTGWLGHHGLASFS